MNASELVNDSLMSRDELLAYMQATFPVELNKIEGIVLHIGDESLNTEGLTYVPHHRRKIYMSSNGTLHIAPIDGLMRIEHFKLQVQCLGYLLNKSIRCEVIGSYDLSQKARAFLDQLDAEYLHGKTIDGLIIGSIWNVNYIVNRRLHPNMLRNTFQGIDKNELNEYIEFRALQASIERASLIHNETLTDRELATFREGAIPSKEDLAIVNDMYQRVASEDISSYRSEFLNDDELRHYVALDFLFFKDMAENTNRFATTLSSDETTVHSEGEITYQLIRLDGGTLLNVGWIHPGLLGELIRQIEGRYKLKSFHMYGKCGGIGDLPLGSLVAPQQTRWNQTTVPIKNGVEDIPLVNFCCVPSPLVETRSWGRAMKEEGVDCVEMELYEVGRHLSQSIKSIIVYYISDRPFDNYKIGQRWGFLEKKLECTNLIVDNIFSLYTHRHLQPKSDL